MAVGRTEYGDISPRTAAYVSVRMLDIGKARMIVEKFAQKVTMPKKEGESIIFRRYDRLPLALTPIAEGITPDPFKLEHEDIAATLLQFGGWTELTDKVEDLHEDPVLQTAASRQGTQAAETIETIRFAYLVTGTNVIYAGGVGARNLVQTPLQNGPVQLAVRTLKNNLGMTIGELIAPTPNFATEAVQPAYFAMCHTNLEWDITQIGGFVPSSQYASMRAIQHEYGKVGEVRFCTTTLLVPWTGAGPHNVNMLETANHCDVYPVLVVAEDAYAVIPLAGKDAIKPMVLNPNTPRGGDPMGQRGSVAWKTWQTATILNDDWIIRIECACTETPT